MKLCVSCAQSNAFNDGNDRRFARLRNYEQNIDFHVHVENLYSMPNLEPHETFPKQFFCDLSSLWLSPQSKMLQLAAGGKPSTWFPPGGLVETATTTSHMSRAKQSMYDDKTKLNCDTHGEQHEHHRTIATTHIPE